MQADLSVFFVWHPWLYLFLIPAIGMRLWAEERKSGTIELLFTLPVNLQEAVVAKFAAAWAFIGVALLLTFPMILTVNHLGSPDNRVILTSYLGSFLMAGAYLAVACVTSSLTKNQVISFVLSVIICFVLVLSGHGVFTEHLNRWLSVPVGVCFSVQFYNSFQRFARGLLILEIWYFFLSVIGTLLPLRW